MNPAEKNQEVSNQQQEILEKREAKQQEQAEIENATPAELRAKLSKRNEDYLFRLENLLVEAGLPKETAESKINGYLPEIIISQRKGIPATKLYGTPQVKAKELINPDQKSSDVKFWQRALDNSLLYLAIFGGMFGLVSLFSQGKDSQPIGIVTIVSVGLLFGALMTYYNDLIVKKKEDRPKLWKIILGGVGIVVFIFAWITLMELPALRVINPVFPGWVVLIIAVVAFVYRRIFRAHYHIVDSPFTSNPKARK